MLHVARQPILDERGRVFGYELLYRHAAGDTSCTADGDLARCKGLPLSAAALQGETNTLRCLLDAVIAYERGEWGQDVSRATSRPA